MKSGFFFSFFVELNLKKSRIKLRNCFIGVIHWRNLNLNITFRTLIKITIRFGFWFNLIFITETNRSDRSPIVYNVCSMFISIYDLTKKKKIWINSAWIWLNHKYSRPQPNPFQKILREKNNQAMVICSISAQVITLLLTIFCFLRCLLAFLFFCFVFWFIDIQ